MGVGCRTQVTMRNGAHGDDGNNIFIAKQELWSKGDQEGDNANTTKIEIVI